MFRAALVCVGLFTGWMQIDPLAVKRVRAQEMSEAGAAPYYCAVELSQFLDYASEPQPLYRCTHFKDGRFSNEFCNTKEPETSPLSQALAPLMDSVACELVDLSRGERVLIEDGGGPDQAFVKHVMALPASERDMAMTYIDAYRVRFYPHYGDYTTSAIQRLPSGHHMMGFTTKAPFWSAQELLLRLSQINLLQRADSFIKQMGAQFDLRILGTDNNRAREIIDMMQAHPDEIAARFQKEKVEAVQILDNFDAPTHKVDCVTLVLSDSLAETQRFLTTGEGRFENRFPRSACGG